MCGFLKNLRLIFLHPENPVQTVKHPWRQTGNPVHLIYSNSLIHLTDCFRTTLIKVHNTIVQDFIIFIHHDHCLTNGRNSNHANFTVTFFLCNICQNLFYTAPHRHWIQFYSSFGRIFKTVLSSLLNKNVSITIQNCRFTS